jgi:hypothetical protein
MSSFGRIDAFAIEIQPYPLANSNGTCTENPKSPVPELPTDGAE